MTRWIPGLRELHERIADTLTGMPDFLLSIIMLLCAFGFGIAALKAPVTAKPLLIAWFIL